MKYFPLLFCFVLFFAFAVSAQTNQNSSCPTVDVRGGGVPRPNETSYFTADVDKKGKELKIEYIWTVGGGKILEGQGTETIAVKVSGDVALTATVEIKGFPEGCPNTNTETPIVAVLSATCPTLDVSGGGIAEIGQPVSFTANIIDPENRQFEYVWTVIGGGKIVAGQGTSTITVELIAEQNIMVTVEVKGFPEGCQNTASDTLGCGLRPPKPNLFDEYGLLPNGDIESRTQNLNVELGNHPGAQGYIISYGTAREIARRERQLRYAITSQNLDASRITLVRGGVNPRGKGVYTRVWIVPPGAENPTPDM